MKNLELKKLIKMELSKNNNLDNFPKDEIDFLYEKEIPITNIKSKLASVMTSPITPAPVDILEKVVPHNFTAGTFFLSERINMPEFLSKEDNLRIDIWLNNAVCNELLRLVKEDKAIHNLIQYKEKEYEITINDFVIVSFFVRVIDGKCLLELVPNQIYQDVITKLIAIFLFGTPDYYPYTERDYNMKLEKICYQILEKLPTMSLFEVFSYSISAGSLGVDLKSSASAASPIKRSLSNIIFYNNIENENKTARLKRMYTQLQAMAKKPYAINCWNDFEEEVVKSKSPILLCWFHDDFAETIFDLYFIQKLLIFNENITVTSIPRSGRNGLRFGNDASSIDIPEHLKKEIFSDLDILNKTGRYHYLETGPCWGAVYAPHFSSEVVNTLLKSNAVIVKGSRSYELLQGINFNGYYASMVCRDFSESVFAVDAESGDSVFVHQPCLLSSFQNFKERHLRLEQLGNKKSMLCKMHAKEFVEALHSNNYISLLSQFSSQQEANEWICNMSTKTNRTIKDIILDNIQNEVQ